MPKLTDILLVKKPGRYKNFTNYRYSPAYKTVLPAELLDTVASRGEKKKAAVCLQEMSMMLACFKKHDFQQTMCGKEVEAFMKCQHDVAETRKRKEEMEAKGLIGRTTGKLPPQQLNAVLLKFPQPKHKS